MLRLYDELESGNGYKVRLLLAHLGLPYERIELDLAKGETRTPEFLTKNPIGKIPTLELDDGKTLAESNAILWYLSEGTFYQPDGRLDRARSLSWMFFEQYSHEPNIAVARSILLHPERNATRAPLLPERHEKGYAALGVMETHLKDRTFFVGERYSIADMSLYAYTHVAHEGGFDLAPYEAVRAWLARVAAQPGYIPITQG
ncbi:MAG TPA: glutathione S-transferase family protein [Kiloniellales bacterium]|nr:glutathione S-transferase family protein [Kiloniellales bacterium]